MRILVLLAVGLCAIPSVARAQVDSPDKPYEFYAQASMIGSDVMNGDSTKFFGLAPGFRMGGAWNTLPHLGLVGDFGYYRFSDHTGRASLATFMAGPRVSTEERFRSSWFLQTLFGGTRWSVDSIPQKFTHRKFAGSIGGGLDIRVTDRVTLRPFEMEFMLINTNNILLDARFSSGFVIRFGRER